MSITTSQRSGHTPNWKEVEILAKENNIANENSNKVLQEKKDNLLNKKDERKVISDSWSAIITPTKVIVLYSLWENEFVFNY